MSAGVDEARFLRSLLNQPSKLVHQATVPSDAFEWSQHQAAYEAILQVADFSDTVTRLQVAKAMNHNMAADDVRSVLDSIEKHEPSISPVVDAGVMRKRWRLRLMREALSKALKECDRGSAESARSLAEEAISGTDWDDNEESFRTVRELIDLANQPLRQGLRLNIPIVSRAIDRLLPGSMTVVGGQTGAYKSSFALYLAEQLDRDGKKPAIVSLEDPPEIWGERVGPAFHDRAAVSDLMVSCLHNHRLDNVLDAMRVAKYKHDADVLLVDYVQLISRADMRGVPRSQQISAIARDLKTECKRLDVPLVLVSQIRRPETGARWKEPTIFDLKETGDLENNAENIVLLWKTGDDDDARVLGKVGKVKTNSRRPRFELLRNVSGAVADPVEYERPNANPEPANEADGRWT